MDNLSIEYGVSLPSIKLQQVLFDLGYSTEAVVGMKVLLDIRGISEPKIHFKSKLAALDWLKEVTQSCFLRRGRERWSSINSIFEMELSTQEYEKIIKAVKLIGFTPKTPKKSVLDQQHISIIPGALDKVVASRFDSLAEEVKATRTIPTNVVAVTGYRKLLDKECPNLSNRTEEEMIKYEWGEATKRHPILYNIPFFITTAKLKENQERSTTMDTVEAAKKYTVIKKSNLIFLHIEQPYAERMIRIFKTFAKPIYLYTQNSSKEKIRLFLYFDEIARTIYYEYPRLRNKYESLKYS